MSYNIIGTIYDAVTSKPIPNATITDNTNPENAYQSDSDGGFNLLVEDDVTLVTISASGYTSQTLDSGDINNNGASDGIINLMPVTATPLQKVVAGVSSDAGLIISIIILSVAAWYLWKYKNSLPKI